MRDMPEHPVSIGQERAACNDETGICRAEAVVTLATTSCTRLSLDSLRSTSYGSACLQRRFLEAFGRDLLNPEHGETLLFSPTAKKILDFWV